MNCGSHVRLCVCMCVNACSACLAFKVISFSLSFSLSVFHSVYNFSTNSWLLHTREPACPNWYPFEVIRYMIIAVARFYAVYRIEILTKIEFLCTHTYTHVYMNICVYVCLYTVAHNCMLLLCVWRALHVKHTNKCVHTHLPIETGVYIHILYISIAFALRYALENRDVLGSGLGTTPLLPLSAFRVLLSHMYSNVRVFMDR